jgi:hypothetical protein
MINIRKSIDYHSLFLGFEWTSLSKVKKDSGKKNIQY